MCARKGGMRSDMNCAYNRKPGQMRAYMEKPGQIRTKQMSYMKNPVISDPIDREGSQLQRTRLYLCDI